MTESGRPTAPLVNRAKLKRSRIYFVIGAVIVIGFALLFARETTRALYVRSQTGSVFNTYVIDHHIGHADISNDASGLQSNFCVLYLNQRIPSDQLEQQVTQLAYDYHSLDGGNSMDVEYNENGKNIKEADAVYEDNTGTLMLTLNFGTKKTVVAKKVNWPANVSGTTSGT